MGIAVGGRGIHCVLLYRVISPPPHEEKHVVHWTKKYDQGVGLHEDYPIHCYYERYEIIRSTPIKSNKFTHFDLKK